jgi:hypothetical protein
MPRQRMQLTKGQVKKYVNKAISGQLETGASKASDQFTLFVLQDRDRTPTDGEKESFLREYLTAVEAIKKRV